MLEADVGIVFHHINYAESSVIVKLLSKNHGLISLMIKGAKKKKSSTIAKLQPLSLVAVEYYYSEQKDLHTVRNLDLSTPFKTLHSNPMKATVLLFLNEILFKSIQQQEKNDPYPSKFPIFDHQIQRPVRSLGKWRATNPELALNPRARSAVMRAMEKIA